MGNAGELRLAAKLPVPARHRRGATVIQAAAIVVRVRAVGDIEIHDAVVELGSRLPPAWSAWLPTTVQLSSRRMPLITPQAPPLSAAELPKIEQLGSQELAAPPPDVAELLHTVLLWRMPPYAPPPWVTRLPALPPLGAELPTSVQSINSTVTWFVEPASFKPGGIRFQHAISDDRSGAAQRRTPRRRCRSQHSSLSSSLGQGEPG